MKNEVAVGGAVPGRTGADGHRRRSVGSESGARVEREAWRSDSVGHRSTILLEVAPRERVLRRRPPDIDPIGFVDTLVMETSNQVDEACACQPSTSSQGVAHK